MQGAKGSTTEGRQKGVMEHLRFRLPPDRIAVGPARPRDGSRLLVVSRKGDSWSDSRFASLATHLEPGDVLVLNNTRVLNARLRGLLTRTGRRTEILFVQPLSGTCWQALVSPGRRVRPGDTVTVGEVAELTIGGATDHGVREVCLSGGPYPTIDLLMESEGLVPLPPYLNRAPRLEDAEDYQTAFGRRPGAIAAPTAGLHFSPAVFKSLERRGVEVAELTLHVGIGTFLPIRTRNPAEHTLKPERYEISTSTCDLLNKARSEHRRIVAVGTTTTRTLEHVMGKYGRFVAGQGETDLYILPGHRFRAIDGLITNFHLPESTLILLVAAFASPKLVLSAYEHAIASEYRFYSYGDCCLFL